MSTAATALTSPSQPVSNFITLPQDVKILVFSFLDPKSKQKAVLVNSLFRNLILIQVQTEERAHLQHMVGWIEERLSKTNYREVSAACRIIYNQHNISTAVGLVNIKQELKRLEKFFSYQLQKLPANDLKELSESFSLESPSVLFKDLIFWAYIRKSEAEIAPLIDSPTNFAPGHLPRPKSEALFRLIPNVLSRGYTQEAFQTALSITDVIIQCRAFLLIFEIWMEQGKSVQEFLDALDVKVRSYFIRALSNKYCDKGDIDQAIAIAEKIEIPLDPFHAFRCLYNKRLCFVVIALYLLAIEAHGSIKAGNNPKITVNDQIISESIEKVTKYLVSKRQYKRALSIAELIPIDAIKVKVISSIPKEESLFF